LDTALQSLAWCLGGAEGDARGSDSQVNIHQQIYESPICNQKMLKMISLLIDQKEVFHGKRDTVSTF
jgi:hypothetical protein